MHALKTIRSRLGMTQQEVAAALGCHQSNVSQYERGQSLPPEAGRQLIDLARSRGLAIDFNHVYGFAELPHAAATATARTEA